VRLWISTPMTSLMVEMYITELGVRSEGYGKWRMRAQTRETEKNG
jgi:hypothetical protein